MLKVEANTTFNAKDFVKLPSCLCLSPCPLPFIPLPPYATGDTVVSTLSSGVLRRLSEEQTVRLPALMPWTSPMNASRIGSSAPSCVLGPLAYWIGKRASRQSFRADDLS